jgi:hypothetical protein
MQGCKSPYRPSQKGSLTESSDCPVSVGDRYEIDRYEIGGLTLLV